MRTILAVSRSRPDAGPDLGPSVRAAFLAVHGLAPVVHLAATGPGGAVTDEVFATDPEAPDLMRANDPVFATVLQQSVYTTAGDTVGGRELLDRLGRDRTGTLRSFAPPFAACFRERADGPVAIATDVCGLRHVYHWQGDGWAAVCSSSLVLALVVGADLDRHAMAIFASVGNHLLEHTPYEGVRRLESGSVAVLHEGRVGVDTYERQEAWAPVGGTRSEQADRGVTVMRDAVRACLDAYPDAGMELSGGYDSRAVLSAIPRSERKGRFALTLGTPGNPDIRVASGIAEQEGLVHQVIDLHGIDDLDLGRVLELGREAARRRDCSANPMGTGVLDWIEAQVDQVPRFNGQNAEFGRAHLYPGQRHHDTFTDQRIDTLAKWRILQNHNTDPVVLQPDFAAASVDAALAGLREQFRRLRVDWLRSLDEYYFQSRMERWAGIDYTAVGYERVVLSPFFHPGYLAWVRACDPQDRRASRVFALMMDRLDPDLARMKLHLGITPHDVAAGGPAIVAKRAFIGTAQTTAKVWQRVRKVGRGSAGADRFAERVVDAWREGGDPSSWLERYGFLDLDGLARVVRGEVAVSSATVAFLVDLEVLSRIRADHRRLIETDRVGRGA